MQRRTGIALSGEDIARRGADTKILKGTDVTTEVDDRSDTHPPPQVVVALGAYLAILGAALGSLLLAVWPAAHEATQASDSATGAQEALDVVWLGLVEFSLSSESAVLFVVLLFGSIGAFVHAATSFVDFVGNRRLDRSWMWWYLLRPFIGAGLALIFYVAVRGGFFGQETQTNDINLFGIATLAGLSGLFSKQATDKLGEVFDTLFRTARGKGDDQRLGALTNPIPTIHSIAPKTVSAGAQALELMIGGDGFLPDSVVLINDSVDNVRTSYIGRNELRATVDPDLVKAVGELSVKVKNPKPGGGVSGGVVLEVT